MKRTIYIILLLAVILSISACTKGSTSSQVIMANKTTETPAATSTPTPKPSPESTPDITPVQSVTPIPVVKPAQTPVQSAPIVTPIQATLAVTMAPPQPTPTPTPTKDPLVFIDAGHGGNDPGTSGYGLVEKDVTLDIAKRLNQSLSNAEVKTYMVRTGDTFMDHRDRIYLANDMKASLYISIHCDWFENSKYSGTQTFYTTAKVLKLGELSELQYAKNIHNQIVSTIKSNDRGVVDRPTLAAVKYATMPSILVETGFLSNPGEAANLATGEYRQKIADAMSAGIQKSLEKANLK
jgi:N-acetylmuramoyl-L-alanine amidase